MEDRLEEYNPLLRVNSRLTFHSPDDLKIYLILVLMCWTQEVKNDLHRHARLDRASDLLDIFRPRIVTVTLLTQCDPGRLPVKPAMTKGLVTKIIGTTFHRPDDFKNIPYSSSDVQDGEDQAQPSLD